jgi:phage gpG-like protein
MPADEDMNRFRAKLEKSLATLISQQTLSPIAIELKNIIQRRTRLGSGVEESGQPKVPLAPLAPSTRRSRKYKKGLGKLSELTSPNKSNLTETSQMLGSLRGYARKNATAGTIDIQPTGDRNRKLAAIHTLGGPKLPKRPFLNLSAQDIKQLTAVLQDKFSEILEKIFKT